MNKKTLHADIKKSPISQVFIAKKMGITTDYLSKKLTNDNRRITLPEMIMICQLIQKDPNIYLNDKERAELKALIKSGKEIAESSTKEDTSSKSGGGESMVIKENGLVEIIKSKEEVIETQKKLLEAKDEIIDMQLKRLAQLELEKEDEKEGAVKESKK